MAVLLCSRGPSVDQPGGNNVNSTKINELSRLQDEIQEGLQSKERVDLLSVVQALVVNLIEAKADNVELEG